MREPVMLENDSLRKAAVARVRTNLGLELGPPIGTSEPVQPAKAMAHGAVAVEAVEQDADATGTCGGEHPPVQIQVGRRVRLIDMPEHAIDVGERTEEIGANLMRLDPAPAHHG